MAKRSKIHRKPINASKVAAGATFGVMSKVLVVGVVIAAICGVWFFFEEPATVVGSIDSQKESKLNNNIARYHMQQHKTFTNEEIQWMIDTEDLTQLIYAADILYQQKQKQWSIQTFRELINKFRSELDANFHEVAYDRLSQLYIETNQDKNAINTLKEAIATKKRQKYELRWYGHLLRLLTNADQYYEASLYADECIEMFRNVSGVHPAACLQAKAQAELHLGRSHLSLPWYIELYEGLLKYMRTQSGEPCPATLVSLATPPHNEESETIRKRLLLNSDLLKDLKLPVGHCLEQEWPYYYSLNGEIKEFSDNSFYQMKCFTNEDKKAVLHKIEDAYIQGTHKHIIHFSENKCEFYVSGLPYPSHFAQPTREYIESKFQLPVKHINKAIILQPYPRNYFHFVVEGLTKLLVAASHPELRDIANLTVLVHDNRFAFELLELLDLGFPVEVYDPDSFRFHIDELFVIDWRFEFDDGPPGSVLGPQYAEYYIPPAPIILALQSKLRVATPLQPRNVVVFIHREGKQRSIGDPQQLYAMLQHISESFGLEFFVHGYTRKMNKRGEQELFSRAVVVMGVHGAGLSNMIFCQEETVIVELPVLPPKVSELSRVASSLNFPFYTVPGFIMNQTETTYERIPPQTLRNIDNTLTRILQGLGHIIKE